jgi:hypothetical protein
MGKMQAEIGHTPKYLIFSDDIAWCRSVLGDQHLYTVPGEQWNFQKMISCAHHIIANSTFSWWGAFLSNNPDKIVISPSCVRGNWFGMNSGVKQDCVDLLPEEWIQIQFR